MQDTGGIIDDRPSAFSATVAASVLFVFSVPMFLWCLGCLAAVLRGGLQYIPAALFTATFTGILVFVGVQQILHAGRAYLPKPGDPDLTEP